MRKQSSPHLSISLVIPWAEDPARESMRLSIHKNCEEINDDSYKQGGVLDGTTSVTRYRKRIHVLPPGIS